jgi:hypothetical protein
MNLISIRLLPMQEGFELTMKARLIIFSMKRYHISELPGFERKEIIFENERMFFEHGGILAATYAIKRHVANLIYSKQKL